MIVSVVEKIKIGKGLKECWMEGLLIVIGQLGRFLVNDMWFRDIEEVSYNYLREECFRQG